jgi:NAD(P)H-dependent FMN reductase
VRVLAISGSLRQGSYNRGLLRAAQELAPPGTEIELYEIGDLPFYHGDVEEAGAPDVVQRFREAIDRALAADRTTIIQVRTDRKENVALHRDVWEAVARSVRQAA